MKQFNVGDKVNLKGKPEEVFTISAAHGYFYSFEDIEVAHLYLQEENYENFYFAGDLEPASI